MAPDFEGDLCNAVEIDEKQLDEKNEGSYFC